MMQDPFMLFYELEEGNIMMLVLKGEKWNSVTLSLLYYTFTAGLHPRSLALSHALPLLTKDWLTDVVSRYVFVS